MQPLAYPTRRRCRLKKSEANKTSRSIGVNAMASKASIKSARADSLRNFGDAKARAKIRFSATFLRPKATAKPVSWTFLVLPKEASAKLPSRSMISVEGLFNGLAFRATLEPDGQGGHWLKVDRK